MEDNQEIHNQIKQFIQEASSLSQNLNSIELQKKSAERNLELIGEGINLAFETRKKGVIKKFGQPDIDTKYSQSKALIENEFRTLHNRVIDYCRTISIIESSLGEKGNSQKIIRQFAKALYVKKVDAQLMRLIGVLQGVHCEQLIYNKDIQVVKPLQATSPVKQTPLNIHRGRTIDLSHSDVKGGIDVKNTKYIGKKKRIDWGKLGVYLTILGIIISVILWLLSKNG